MTRLVSIIWFIMLTGISALHVYWALGGLWPGTSEQELIHTVVGDPNMTQMFSMEMTLIVSSLIFLAGFFALMASGIFQIFPRWFVRLATIVLTLVFTGRAASGFYANYVNFPFTEPFATYDLWLYSPLCLVLGLGFAFLTLTAKKTS